MFKVILIRKIKRYLSYEYREESIPLDSIIRMDAMRLSSEDDCFLDDEADYEETPIKVAQRRDIKKYIDDTLEEVTFAEKLNEYMYEKACTTAMIYKRCLIDRKLISKITTQKEYHPSKDTVLALCIGLQLSVTEGEEFLSLAGYGFNRSSKYDLIIKFMLENKIYNLDTINDVLMYFGQPYFR